MITYNSLAHEWSRLRAVLVTKLAILSHIYEILICIINGDAVNIHKLYQGTML